MNWHEQVRLFRKALKYGQEMGPVALARSVWHKARQRYTAALAKKDILAEYAFIQKESIGKPLGAGQVSNKTMNWVVDTSISFAIFTTSRRWAWSAA